MTVMVSVLRAYGAATLGVWYATYFGHQSFSNAAIYPRITEISTEPLRIPKASISEMFRCKKGCGRWLLLRTTDTPCCTDTFFLYSYVRV